MVDGVFLNGYGPYRFVIDPGAQVNQVDVSIAHKIGLTPAFQVEVATAAGTTPASGARVAAVSLGSATGTNQEFLFTRLDGVQALASDIKGVLGQEFLAHFDYLLDFARHRLLIGAAALEGGNRVSFETISGCPVIETSEGKLVLDSGTNSAILYRSAPSSSEWYNPVIRTASGAASVTRIQNLRLRIAGRDYHPANAASVPRALLRGDGLLPASLFHAVFVSNSGHYVILDPRVDSGVDGPPPVKGPAASF